MSKRTLGVLLGIAFFWLSTVALAQLDGGGSGRRFDDARVTLVYADPALDSSGYAPVRQYLHPLPIPAMTFMATLGAPYLTPPPPPAHR